MKKLFCNSCAAHVCRRGKYLCVLILLLISVVMVGCSQQDKDDSNLNVETTAVTEKETESTASLTAGSVTEEVTTIQPTTEVVTEQIIVTESPTENTYEKYLGTWKDVDSYGQGFTVIFTSINGNNVECYMCRTAPNAAHIAMTEKISTQIVEGNKVYFDFTDSFMNYGNGVLTLNEDTVTLSATVTEFYQPYLYAFMGEGELVKTSDSTAIPY
ncbi:MAG: hypothetical protein ACI4XI_05875 [Ruminococcus sp.]